LDKFRNKTKPKKTQNKNKKVGIKREIKNASRFQSGCNIIFGLFMLHAFVSQINIQRMAQKLLD
jgi:hypothetical protein